MKKRLFLVSLLTIIATQVSATQPVDTIINAEGRSGSTIDQGHPQSKPVGLEKGSNEHTDMMKGAGVKTEGKTVQPQGPSENQIEHDLQPNR